MRLVNGAIGTVKAICYQTGGPPDLPLAAMAAFDKYCGPTLHDGTVPVTRSYSSFLVYSVQATDTTETGMGCDYSQVTRINPVQGRCQ